MADHLSLSTADPLFDPDRPLRVNGSLFLPARRVLAKVSGRADPLEPVGGDHVDRSAVRAKPSNPDGPGTADPAHHPDYSGDSGMSGTNALADQLEALASLLDSHGRAGTSDFYKKLDDGTYRDEVRGIARALRTADKHQQALAERDAEIVRLRELAVQAAQIIGQIELDQRYPPAPDSMERRIERARDWLARAALEGNDANNTGEEQ